VVTRPDLRHDPEDSPEEVRSATASFVAKVLAGSNQMKTCRKGRLPLQKLLFFLIMHDISCLCMVHQGQ
jgi:hypothetical protein